MYASLCKTHNWLTHLSAQSDSFWIIARAVAEFVASPGQGNGLLPLSGGVPDMKAESREYVKLQNLYPFLLPHPVFFFLTLSRMLQISSEGRKRRFYGLPERKTDLDLSGASYQRDFRRGDKSVV